MSQVGLRMCVWLHYSSFGSTIRRARLVIERLQVQIPAGAAGEFSSPESTLGADSYLVSVPPSCYCSGTQKTLLSLQKVQMAGNTETHIHPRPNGVGMGCLCCCPGIVWEPVRKQADTQIVRKHLATVVSAR